jgi:membrane associated rhomboid family serine protease
MIPLRDANPSSTVPLVNYSLIGVNVAVFLFELSLGGNGSALLASFGVVPARVSAALDTMTFQPDVAFSFLSSMFLHGGWMHLIGNMVFLHVFGDNIEDSFGHGPYLLFYVACGCAAAATQVAIDPRSVIPMVGASGAIAGVLGAYVLLHPRAKILTLIPIFFFLQLVELPAFLFLGIWFLMQIFSGVLSLQIGADAGGVAWWAHIGGFAAGVIMLPFLRRGR